jgi:glycosyltransferase involved in cell wall biosynthesis
VVVAACRALGVPVVLHLHAAELHHFYRTLPAPLQRLTRWVFSLPSVCIVLGAASRQFVIGELEVSPEKVEIVINGVPEPTVSRRRPDESAPQRILFLGNLSERKGLSDLLGALAMPGFSRNRLDVRIAGGGDVEGYRAKAQALGVDSFVTFEGWADQRKATQLMANADLMVLPSYDEGLPLVILEALANGVAVVCTPVGEIPGALADGVTACFVQPGDVAGIAAGLQKVLGRPALRESLECNGRSLFEQQFSFDRFFESIAQIHRRSFGICAQLSERH